MCNVYIILFYMLKCQTIQAHILIYFEIWYINTRKKKEVSIQLSMFDTHNWANLFDAKYSSTFFILSLFLSKINQIECPWHFRLKSKHQYYLSFVFTWHELTVCACVLYWCTIYIIVMLRIISFFSYKIYHKCEIWFVGVIFTKWEWVSHFNWL